uniref:Calpain catalytic domain-containing protein n=1 Tax=Rhabditophanes sp. KR3021 TaxID=114890 RepID=A0AC35TZX3_9BILA
MGDGVEEEFQKVILEPDQFNGLIGNFIGNAVSEKFGGGAAGNLIGDLAGNFLGGGGGNSGGNDFGNLLDGFFGGGRDNNSGGGGRSSGGGNLDDILGGLLGGKSNKGDRYDSSYDNSGKSRKRDKVIGFLGDILSKKGNDNRGEMINILGIGGLISGLVSGGGGGGRGGTSGGPNTSVGGLRGGVVNLIGDLVGEAGHRFLGIDPSTGRMIGAIAGNVLFDLGGKDNKLSDIGKIVLDNIISGKYQRDVRPFVPPSPRRGGTAPSRHETEAALDFYTERDRCIQNKELFEDPHFPADDSSLFYSENPGKRIVWKRPNEIVKEPVLIDSGHSRFDVIQGSLGDCWLIAGAASLTLRDELFYRVVVPDQSFTESYAGIFHFTFWSAGKWVDVVIDDRLPVDANTGELVYIHSESNNEFWSALFEKAYAKLHGSYEALKGGTTSEIMTDCTGGISEFIDLTTPPKNCLQMIMKGFEMGSLFGCSIEADQYTYEAKMPNGLVKGHAYSITACKLVNGPNGQTCLLRIRNPWANEVEWKGAWSDNSSEWDYIDRSEREQMGIVFAHDGEFWMSYEDFMANFEKMEICNLGPDVMDEIAQMTGVKPHTQTWSANTHEASWVANQSAGGCRNYLRTFANNPQIRVQLSDSDPNDADDLVTVIFSLMQKHRRLLKKQGLDNLAIGFAVYDAGNMTGPLDQSFFAANKSYCRSPAFINLREMTARFRVPPGNYVIVPSTFEPNEEAEWMLRIFTNGFIESEEL